MFCYLAQLDFATTVVYVDTKIHTNIIWLSICLNMECNIGMKCCMECLIMEMQNYFWSWVLATKSYAKIQVMEGAVSAINHATNKNIEMPECFKRYFAINSDAPIADTVGDHSEEESEEEADRKALQKSKQMQGAMETTASLWRRTSIPWPEVQMKLAHSTLEWTR